jgi:hypothetical protein
MHRRSNANTHERARCGQADASSHVVVAVAVAFFLIVLGAAAFARSLVVLDAISGCEARLAEECGAVVILALSSFDDVT